MLLLQLLKAVGSGLCPLEVFVSAAADCMWLIPHGDHGSSAYHAGSVGINFRCAHIGNLQTIATTS